MNCRITTSGKIMIEGATLKDVKFRHFSGEKDLNHKNGGRDFVIELPDDFAEELVLAGWRVKQGKEREDGTKYRDSINVKVKLECDGARKGPTITRWTSSGPLDLDDELISKDVDTDQIEEVAFVIRPYYNRDYGNATPYLENMTYKVEENPYRNLYASSYGMEEE